MKAPLQYLISQEWFREIKYKAKNKLEVKKKQGTILESLNLIQHPLNSM